MRSLTVVCLGDSITSGYKLQEPGRLSYPAQLAKMAHGSWRVLNYGVNGATVLENGDIPIVAQEAYQQALTSVPDIVVLMLGTNDGKNANWRYRADFVSNYVSLIQSFAELPSRPLIIVCTIPPIFQRFSNGLSTRRSQQINVLLQQVVGGSKVVALDVYTPLSRRPSFFGDAVHPTVRGAREIASLVFNQINGMLGPSLR